MNSVGLLKIEKEFVIRVNFNYFLCDSSSSYTGYTGNIGYHSSRINEDGKYNIDVIKNLPIDKYEKLHQDITKDEYHSYFNYIYSVLDYSEFEMVEYVIDNKHLDMFEEHAEFFFRKLFKYYKVLLYSRTPLLKKDIEYSKRLMIKLAETNILSVSVIERIIDDFIFKKELRQIFQPYFRKKKIEKILD